MARIVFPDDSPPQIKGTNTPGFAAPAVAEHTLALMLAASRQITQLDKQVKNGGWPRGLVQQLFGKTLGIVGLGAIGGHLARLAKGIGMKVITWTFHPPKKGTPPIWLNRGR